MSSIKHIIAVGSGKGGVGKSTVSVNIAISLQTLGYKVGLLDADIMGPSIPCMLGITTKPDMQDKLIQPIVAYGINVMSMGMLIDQDQPVVLRGAMVTKYLQTLINEVAWGNLDYLVIDLPPGTGDIQISLCQAIPLSCAIIVTTPQDISLKIATKGLKMFELVQVPILGIIENMSFFTCTHCGHEAHIFGSGGGKMLSNKADSPLLGTIPLDTDIVASGDAGYPIVLSYPNAIATKQYLVIAEKIINSKMRQNLTIKTISQKDIKTLSILWSDDRVDNFDTTNLRQACSCAICKNAITKSSISNITVNTINHLGNYAIRITWSDGHNAGIYSFKHLRDIADNTKS